MISAEHAIITDRRCQDEDDLPGALCEVVSALVEGRFGTVDMRPTRTIYVCERCGQPNERLNRNRRICPGCGG